MAENQKLQLLFVLVMTLTLVGFPASRLQAGDKTETKPLLELIYVGLCRSDSPKANDALIAALSDTDELLMHCVNLNGNPVITNYRAFPYWYIVLIVDESSISAAGESQTRDHGKLIDPLASWKSGENILFNKANTEEGHEIYLSRKARRFYSDTYLLKINIRPLILEYLIEMVDEKSVKTDSAQSPLNTN